MTDAPSRGECLGRQKQASARSRRGQGAGRRAPAPDAQRGRELASTTGRRRSTSSDRTNARAPRAATTSTAPAGKRATRLRESGKPGPRTKAGERTTGGAPSEHERQRAAAPSHQSHGLLTALWRLLLISLRRLQRKLRRALATPQARRILTALLARRLPGPLRALVQGLGDPDQRGFLFLVVGGHSGRDSGDRVAAQHRARAGNRDRGPRRGWRLDSVGTPI